MTSRIALTATRGRSRTLVLVVLAVVVAGLAAAGAMLAPRIESAPPQIALDLKGEAVGTAPLALKVEDAGTGLASVAVTLVQGGTEHKLVAEQPAAPARERAFTLELAKLAGVKEGPAVLRVSARDAAFPRGNEAVLERPVTLDLTPPTLELIADDRYVNFGGVGVLVYKASPDTVRSGVRFGTRFFPGYAGQVAGHPDRSLVLFAHAYDTAPDARPRLVATDAAGNTRELAVAYELKDVKYRKSTIALSEAFLQNKVAPLIADTAARPSNPKELFLAVNKGLRQANEERIAQITGQATPQRLWQGAFVQLSNSKVEANFADERTYTLAGEAIDTAYHLGYDLSVTRAYPVEAANAGTVVFAGDLGIYGGTVIVDHGLGLFTLYSHLSAIDAKVGDALATKQILGRTGETGLAAGDHLHYGVYLAGVAVLPVEWWDPKWIDANLTPKLEGRSGTEIAQAQAPVRKAVRKTGGRGAGMSAGKAAAGKRR